MDILNREKSTLIDRNKNYKLGNFFINLKRKLTENNYGDYIWKKLPEYILEIKEILKSIDFKNFSFHSNNIIRDLKEIMNQDNNLYMNVLNIQYDDLISIDNRFINPFFQKLFSENINDDKKTYYKYMVYLSITPKQLCLINYLESLEIIFEKTQREETLNEFVDILDKISSKFQNYKDFLNFNHIFSSFLFYHFFINVMKNNFNLEIKLISKWTSFQINCIEFTNNTNFIINACKNIKNFIGIIKNNLDNYNNYYNIIYFLNLIINPFKSRNNNYFNYKEQLKDMISFTIPQIISQMFKKNEIQNFNYLKNSYILNYDIIISSLLNSGKKRKFCEYLINILKSTQINLNDIKISDFQKIDWKKEKEIGINLIKIFDQIKENSYELLHIFDIDEIEVGIEKDLEFNENNDNCYDSENIKIKENNNLYNNSVSEKIINWNSPYNNNESYILLWFFYKICVIFEKLLISLKLIQPIKEKYKSKNKVIIFKDKKPVYINNDLFKKPCRINLRFICKKSNEKLLKIFIIVLFIYYIFF